MEIYGVYKPMIIELKPIMHLENLVFSCVC